ncbi:MAG TPA: DUF4870 domain-containing protein [Flavobacteriaceae bacterium]|nr:DUF4870 domain-containing protein [Flavobacteriaceae bacterium]
MQELITTTDQERNMGMFTHLGTFLGYFFPFANIFVPLIIWQSNKESDFLDKHGKAVMNFQLSLFLYHLVALLIFLAFFLTNILDMIGLRSEDTSYATFGEPEFAGATLIAVFGLVFFYFILQAIYIITTIIGGIRASKGKLYDYPLTIRFIR